MDDSICGLVCFNCEAMWKKEIFTESDLVLLNNNKIYVSYDRGDVIIKQGTFSSELIFIREGLVKIVVEDRKVGNTIVRIASDNDVVGLPVLGFMESHPCSVIALTQVHLCYIRKEAILTILGENKNLIKFILNWYSKHFIDMYNKIAHLSTRNNNGKLASALIYLFDNFNKKNIFEYVSRKDLAELSGISLESVNKILLQLKKENVIKLSKRNMELLKVDVIKHLCEIG